MNTTTTTTELATTEANVEAVLARTGGDPIATLKEAYATAQASEKAHRTTREAAEHGMKVAMVWQARIAYRAASVNEQKADGFSIEVRDSNGKLIKAIDIF